jgi:hypothetical protein
MAHTHHSSDDTPHIDINEREHTWHGFLELSKWSAVTVLGLVFFLILWRVGHWPLVPTAVIMAAIAYGLGKLFG